MSDQGIKVTKAGKDIRSTDIRDWILHSDYSMFKYNATFTGQIVIAPGGTTGSLEVNHGLGYVPAFLVYQDGMLFPTEIRAYATDTKIHIDRLLSSPYNQTIVQVILNELYVEDTPLGFPVVAGKRLGTQDGSAIRFTGVTLPQGQSLSVATIHYTNGSGGTDTNNTLFSIHGIDEDNTASFTSNPMGRSKTAAVTNISQTYTTQYIQFTYTVTDLVQEIINRSGWASGNAMGFIFNDNGSPDNNFIITRHQDNFVFEEVFLKVIYLGGGSETTNYKVIVFKDKISD